MGQQGKDTICEAKHDVPPIDYGKYPNANGDQICTLAVEMIETSSGNHVKRHYGPHIATRKWWDETARDDNYPFREGIVLDSWDTDYEWAPPREDSVAEATV